MKSRKLTVFGLTLSSAVIAIRAQQPSGDTVRVDPDDIGGVVTSSKDPEAGVWVIAETTRAPFHNETGKGTSSKVVHFQLRPDPLVR